MKISTDSGGGWAVVLALVALALVGIAFASVAASSGAFSLHVGEDPIDVAEADLIRQMSAIATQQALNQQQDIHRLEMEKAQQIEQIQQAERLAASKQRIELGAKLSRYSSYSITILFAAGVILLATWTISYSLRIRRQAALPVMREIGPYTVIIETNMGPFLIDTLTGTRSQLIRAHGNNLVRASLLTKIEVAERMALAAENIARATNDSTPSTGLASIAGIGPPIEIKQINQTTEPG